MLIELSVPSREIINKYVAYKSAAARASRSPNKPLSVMEFEK